jgi:hypothetical protein
MQRSNTPYQGISEGGRGTTAWGNRDNDKAGKSLIKSSRRARTLSGPFGVSGNAHPYGPSVDERLSDPVLDELMNLGDIREFCARAKQRARLEREGKLRVQLDGHRRVQVRRVRGRDGQGRAEGVERQGERDGQAGEGGDRLVEEEGGCQADRDCVVGVLCVELDIRWPDVVLRRREDPRV